MSQPEDIRQETWRGLKIAAGVVGGVALAIMIVVFSVESDGRNEPGQNSGASEGQQSAVASASAQTTMGVPPFGAEQNDSEGYGGHLWGSTSTEGLHETQPMWNYNMFVKVVGPPGDIVNGFYSPSEETAPKIRTYVDNVSDKITYGFYHSQMAFVLVTLDGTFEDAQHNLANKYSRCGDVGPNALGDNSAPGGWEGYGFSGDIYRRGKTNTRIYLMHSIDESGATREVDLLYIPNSYVLAIRGAWWGKYNDLKQETAQQQQAAEAAARQRDQHAIQ